MFEIGQEVSLEEYTRAAVFCNQAADRHLEQQNGRYIIAANPALPGLSLEQQVRSFEMQTGLTRAVRELVLAETSGVSDYVKQQAQQIEERALLLRKSL